MYTNIPTITTINALTIASTTLPKPKLLYIQNYQRNPTYKFINKRKLNRNGNTYILPSYFENNLLYLLKIAMITGRDRDKKEGVQVLVKMYVF